MKLGASFSDSIHTEKQYSRRHYDSEWYSRIPVRDFLFPLLLCTVIIILAGRLLILQIVSGPFYRTLSNTNRTRTIFIHAPRGIIFDRYGNPLVLNTPGYREIVNGKTILLNQKDALTKIASGDKNLEVDSLRSYPMGEAAAHVIGYIGQISPQDLQLAQFQDYSAGDLVGKMGIEESFEAALRGTEGKVLTEVDATGKPVRTLGQTDPIPGQNVTLTIDSQLQKAAYQAMAPIKKGAVIVSTPQGEILALVSMPSFDPNLFTQGKNYRPTPVSAYKTISQVLLDNNGQPLLNRAIAGEYPPGSTFKIITAVTALETNTIDANYIVNDTGILRIGSFSFANWFYTSYGKTDGQVTVVKAIQRSNDIFFYTVGQLLGVDKLSAGARKFGLGSPLGIVLPGEASGLVPTKEWKEKVVGDKWYLGDDYHYAIGQGYLLTTPLQVNAWTQVIANGGTLYQPQLILHAPHTAKNTHIVTDQTESLLRQGMIAACSPGGVAYPLFNYSVKNPHLPIDGVNITADASKSADYRHIVIACKTGTAQEGGTSALPHAWITLFAPAYKPQIVVTVLSEEAGEGSDIAAPVAKNILDYYFEKGK
ncbi:MAG TPA: penicillin-binding transpeptidase domain-containing protein [Patescibacteria group bacterium]|nr:penicillin-binding transpeptidase domain-containing protein [Patescibacteria group bacterium]